MPRASGSGPRPPGPPICTRVNGSCEKAAQRLQVYDRNLLNFMIILERPPIICEIIAT